MRNADDLVVMLLGGMFWAGALVMVFMACSPPPTEFEAVRAGGDVLVAACTWPKGATERELELECGTPCGILVSPAAEGVRVFRYCVDGCASDCTTMKAAIFYRGELNRAVDVYERRP